MIHAGRITELNVGSQGVTRPSVRRSNRNQVLLLLLIALHIPLGLLLYQYRVLTWIHPIAVLVLGLFFAIRKNQKLERVAYLAAYIVGSEVLWRMARTEVFWEFGKYAVALIMMVALVRRRQWRLPPWPSVYLLFLVPGSMLTVLGDTLGDAKDKISFNMSGPLLLFVSCWFFSSVRLTPAMVKRLLTLLAVPVISVLMISLFYTVTVENIEFGHESNLITSGFFGPNQVSSMLGLGAFICLSLYLLFRNSFIEIAFISAFALLFAAQSVLTFSRGGMYNALGAAIAVMLFRLGDLQHSLKQIAPVLALGVLFFFIVFPYLDNFTGGALQSRFENTGTTGRTEIVEADMQIFANNPLLGAGVGEAKQLREAYFGRAVGAHTEFARIIAEHGLFGIFAIISLLIGFIGRLGTERSNLTKALAAGAVVWSSLFMLNAGMRLAAPSFMWGLSFLVVVVPHPARRIPKRARGRNAMRLRAETPAAELRVPKQL